MWGRLNESIVFQRITRILEWVEWYAFESVSLFLVALKVFDSLVCCPPLSPAVPCRPPTTDRPFNHSFTLAAGGKRYVIMYRLAGGVIIFRVDFRTVRTRFPSWYCMYRAARGPSAPAASAQHRTRHKIRSDGRAR